MTISIIFFFSSRRRHTRWPRDWSSDVCSSDLRAMSWALAATSSKNAASDSGKFSSPAIRRNSRTPTPPVRRVGPPRSEERRVGKECRARGAQKEKKKKEKKYNE